MKSLSEKTFLFSGYFAVYLEPLIAIMPVGTLRYAFANFSVISYMSRMFSVPAQSLCYKKSLEDPQMFVPKPEVYDLCAAASIGLLLGCLRSLR